MPLLSQAQVQKICQDDHYVMEAWRGIKANLDAKNAHEQIRLLDQSLRLLSSNDPVKLFPIRKLHDGCDNCYEIKLVYQSIQRKNFLLTIINRQIESIYPDCNGLKKEITTDLAQYRAAQRKQLFCNTDISIKALRKYRDREEKGVIIDIVAAPTGIFLSAVGSPNSFRGEMFLGVGVGVLCIAMLAFIIVIYSRCKRNSLAPVFHSQNDELKHSLDERMTPLTPEQQAKLVKGEEECSICRNTAEGKHAVYTAIEDSKTSSLKYCGPYHLECIKDYEASLSNKGAGEVRALHDPNTSRSYNDGLVVAGLTRFELFYSPTPTPSSVVIEIEGEPQVEGVSANKHSGERKGERQITPTTVSTPLLG